MAQNGISTLPTKELRQVAKLEISQLRRLAGGDTTAPYYRVNNIYDINLLPAKYVDNTPVSSGNLLQLARPWTAGVIVTTSLGCMDGDAFSLMDGNNLEYMR